MDGWTARQRQCVYLIMFFANFVSSTSLIFLNKWLYQHYNFSKILLIAYHFVCTTVALFICCLLQVIKFKRLPMLRTMPLTLSFTAFILLTNFSLDLNTVGTSQVLKCLSDPLLIAAQAFFYNKHQPRSIQLSLLPMILGVIINSLYDLQFTSRGFLVGLASAVVGTHYTIQVNHQQSSLHVSAAQLLAYQAPLSSALLLGYVILITPSEIYKIHVGSSNYAVAMLTGFAAFWFNLSTYWILGNTSVVTFTVFSKTKLCATVMGGFILFNEPFHWNQISGIGLTLFGVVFYSFVKIVISRREARLDRMLQERQVGLMMPRVRSRTKSENNLDSFDRANYWVPSHTDIAASGIKNV